MMRQQNEQEQIEETALPVFTQQQETEVVTETLQQDENAQKIESLERALHRRRRAMRWMSAPIAGIFLSLSALASNPGINLSYPQNLAISTVLLANYGWLFTLLMRGVIRQKKAVGALANTEDLRAVGVMAEALNAGEPANSIAGAVLIHILPLMRAADAALMTPMQRIALREGLRRAANRMAFGRYNPTLAIAILGALEHIGEAGDLPLVERLARQRARTLEQQSIRQAAEACVPFLRARAEGRERVEPALSEERRQEATQLSAEAVEALSARVKQIARLRQRNVNITAAGAIGATGFSLATMLSSQAGHPASPLLSWPLFLSAGVMGCFSVRGLYAQRNLTNALIHSNDLRLIGPLLETAASSEISGATAALVLTRLLPRLQASDAEMLDEKARECLNSALLKHCGNAEFVLSALKALQQIGDARALPVVLKLAHRADRSAAGQSIREAAQECLPFLEVRAAQQQASQTLLRASDVSAMPPDILLRPVQNPTDVPAEELLRPGTPRPELDEEVSESERTDRPASPFDASRALRGLSV